MKNFKAAPFLKWAGGKRNLLTQFEEFYPDALKLGKIKKYIEPFLGGGAVFFELQKQYDFEEVILNDINAEIISAYKVIQSNIEDLIPILKNLEFKYLPMDTEQRSKMYYEIRDKFNYEKNNISYDIISNELITHVSHLLFLNKTCFNGLYRLNKLGDFNVPIGKYKNPTICDEDNLKNVSEALQGVTLIYGDFKEVEKYIDIDKNTFVYMDPPYRPLSSSSNFTSYSKSDFNDDNQRDLANWFKKLDKEKNAYLMLSNSDPTNSDPNDTFFEDLYEGYIINKVVASRSINSKSAGRGKINELVILNKK